MHKYKISQMYTFFTEEQKNIESLQNKILNKEYYKFLHPKWTHHCRGVEIKLLANLLQKNSSILEIGSGDGYVAYILERDYGIKVLASDMEPRFPQYADVKRIDGQSTGIQQQKYDVIISVHVLEHIEYIDGALKEFSRLLKDDGIMYHLVPTRSNMLFTVLMQPLSYFRSVFLYINGYYFSKFLPFRNKNILRFIYRFLKAINPINFFWGAGHGIYNRIDCFKNWKVKKWVEVFERNDFEIIRVQTSEISYSMHKIFPFKFIKIRKYLANIGLGSTELLVLRKRKDV